MSGTEEEVIETTGEVNAAAEEQEEASDAEASNEEESEPEA